jgi:hypothetical protein
MSIASIFEPRRFEFQGSHLFFISPKLDGQLHTEKPIFLVGLRGSGKTTLLFSLNWSQRLNNAPYKKQLEIEHQSAFYDRVIGVYTKLPESKVSAIGNWLGDFDNTKARLFGLYIDLLTVELILDAVANLNAASVVTGTGDLEHSIVAEILQDTCQAACWGEFLNVRRQKTFLELKRAVVNVRRDLERHADLQLSVSSAISRFEPPQFGELAKKFASKLALFCNSSIPSASLEWRFRVCMDEGEHLTTEQQRVVNSIYRLANWPLFYAIAYVSQPDFRNTYLPGLTLADADRELIILSTQSDSEFERYVEGVVNVRLKNDYPSLHSIFSVRGTLGDLNLDAILNDVLRDSVNPMAKSLASEAVQIDPNAPFPPILRSYFEKVTGKTSRTSDSKWEKRREESGGYRKKSVGAYLSLMNDLDFHPKYAFAEMVLQLSDKCIRDFLSQMQSIFLASDLSVEDFLVQKIHWKVQHIGIMDASDQKRKSFDSFLCVAGVESIIDGLGYTTAYLQSRCKRRLSSPELGRYQIKASQLDNDSFLQQAIEDGIIAGFIRYSDGERGAGESIEIQLHSALAPYYGFSYRGPMYPCEVRSDDLLAFARESDKSIQQQSLRLAEKLSGGSDAMPLFDRIDGGAKDGQS